MAGRSSLLLAHPQLGLLPVDLDQLVVLNDDEDLAVAVPFNFPDLVQDVLLFGA
jgi:hypothetical protein